MAVFCLLVIFSLYAVALSSVYYDSAYFARVEPNEVVSGWVNVVDLHGFVKDLYSCERIYS